MPPLFAERAPVLLQSSCVRGSARKLRARARRVDRRTASHGPGETRFRQSSNRTAANVEWAAVERVTAFVPLLARDDGAIGGAYVRALCLGRRLHEQAIGDVEQRSLLSQDGAHLVVLASELRDTEPCTKQLAHLLKNATFLS